MLDAVHLDDNVLEQYAMNRLSVTDAEAVEDHISVCHSCLDRLDAEVALIQDLKSVLEKDRATEMAGSTVSRPRSNWVDWWKFPVPATLWTGAATMAMALLLFFVWRPVPVGNLATVVLTATRGPSTAINGTGPFDFEIFVPDSAETYSAVLVNSEGGDVWNGEAKRKDGKLHAIVRRKLNPGQYFLRVSDPSSHSTHEFGFTIAP